MLTLLTEQNNGCFSILSSNVESINAKMNEIEAFVEELSPSLPPSLPPFLLPSLQPNS